MADYVSTASASTTPPPDANQRPTTTRYTSIVDAIWLPIGLLPSRHGVNVLAAPNNLCNKSHLVCNHPANCKAPRARQLSAAWSGCSEKLLPNNQWPDFISASIHSFSVPPIWDPLAR